MEGLEFYAGEDGQHYWRLISPRNGNILAIGGEGYASKAGAEKGFASAKALILAGVAIEAQQSADEVPED